MYAALVDVLTEGGGQQRPLPMQHRFWRLDQIAFPVPETPPGGLVSQKEIDIIWRLIPKRRTDMLDKRCFEIDNLDSGPGPPSWLILVIGDQNDPTGLQPG
jgi:hypothetical protein